MKTYALNAAEFAKLELLLGRAVSLLHQNRSMAEFERFQVEFFPLLREVYYQVLGPKIDDEQREAISASDPDPWDRELPSEKAIEILEKIFQT